MEVGPAAAACVQVDRHAQASGFARNVAEQYILQAEVVRTQRNAFFNKMLIGTGQDLNGLRRPEVE